METVRKRKGVRQGTETDGEFITTQYPRVSTGRKEE